MSRTTKDKPFHTWRNPDYWDLTKPSGEKKHRSSYDYHGFSTPSWWTRLKMNRPQRRKYHLDERKILVSDVDNFDFEDFGKKPHEYYW